MNWGAVGAIAELGGAIAVVATIVYLSFQIRQTNQISVSNTTTDILNKFDEFNRMIVSDRSLRVVLTKSETLSEEESEQVYTFANICINTWMAVQTAHDNNQLDDNMYNAMIRDVRFAMERWPNIRPAIAKHFSVYPEAGKMRIFDAYHRSESGDD